MAKDIVTGGAASKIYDIFIRSATTGAGLTGLAFGTTGLTAYYHRNTAAAAVAITLGTMTVGTFTSSGFAEIDPTNMPGWYQFCPPNAALAAGATSCSFHLKGAPSMVDLPFEVDISTFDLQTAVQTVDMVKINGSATAAANVSTAAQTMATGQAVTGTLTSTVFTTNLAATTVDGYKNRTIRFTSGALSTPVQESVITAYSNTGQITVSPAFTTAPSNNDFFEII